MTGQADLAAVERAGVEAVWIGWARTFLAAGDVPGALGALRHAQAALAALDARRTA